MSLPGGFNVVAVCGAWSLRHCRRRDIPARKWQSPRLEPPRTTQQVSYPPPRRRDTGGVAGKTEENTHRFPDSLKRLCCFGEQILIRCPACHGCAQIISLPAVGWDRCRWRDQARRRLSCLRCGHTRDWTAPRTYNAVAVVPEPSGPIEPFFGLPLWLQTDCCHDRNSSPRSLDGELAFRVISNSLRGADFSQLRSRRIAR